MQLAYRGGFYGLSHRLKLLPSSWCFGVIAILLGTHSAQAVNLLNATPGTVTLACNTATGLGNPVNVIVKPAVALSGSSTIVVSLGTLPAGISVVAPATQTLSTANQAAGLTYAVNFAPGCAGATAGTANLTLPFRAGGAPDASVTVASTVTATASALTPAPSPVALTCVKNGSVYTPGPAKTVSVTSAAAGGTPFTVDTTNAPPAAWLSTGGSASGTATGNAVTFTLQAAAGCGGFATGTSNSTTLHLVNTPAPDKLVPVTLQVVTPTTLSTVPAAPKLTYQKGSGAPANVDVAVSSSAATAPFFSVDTASLPIWLTVDATSGKTPRTLRFSSTVVADTLAPGTYSATVYLKVSGSGDLAVPVSMLVTNPAPRLSVVEGVNRNLSWVIGQPSPSAIITAVSTDSPIPYTVTTGGTLTPIVPAFSQSGLAYSFGTEIPVSFDPSALAAAQPGTTLSGNVTLQWGNPPATTVVTFNVNVQAPGASVSSLTPASIPTSNAGQSFTVVLSGSGFVPSTDPAQRTKVGIVANGAILTNNNISYNVVNPSNIILTITVPATADPVLPFSPTGPGGSVRLGVCNPSGGTCSFPSGAATLMIGNGPIIQSVTSAATFIQGAVAPNVSPYDILSIFGTNFCTSGGTGCSSAQVLYGMPDANLKYPTTLSPDSPSATQRSISVKFQTHATPPVAIGNGTLLFATNNQINVLAPSDLASRIGEQIDVVVAFGLGGATTLNSAPYMITVAATNPGVFTVGANGQGVAAALNSRDYALVMPGNEAGMRSTATDSDTLMLYLTGLGAPDSTADNGSSGGGAWSADCITTSSYLTSLNSMNGASLTSIDGLVLQSNLFNTGRLSPCLLSNSTNLPTVTVGGVASTVTYAGWVAGSIAGLYQINLRLPGSTAGPFTDANGATLSTLTVPATLPLVVTAAGNPSQTGVVLNVAPRLKVVAPTALTGTVGAAWSATNASVVASQGTAPYRFLVTSGLFPAGLTLNSSTGTITGIPQANTAGTYSVTVTAIDSANVPLKDTVSFSLTIAGGLMVSTSGTAPFNTTFSVANASVTTASATGGTYPYAYALTAPATMPAGMTINSSTGLIGVTAATPAGTYHVTVTATDSSATPLTGSTTFDIVVALKLTNSNPVSVTHGVANASVSTITTTGNTGSLSYSLDATTAALGWISISPSGVISTTTGSVAGTRTVTVTATDGTAAPGAATAGRGTVTLTITVI